MSDTIQEQRKEWALKKLKEMAAKQQPAARDMSLREHFASVVLPACFAERARQRREGEPSLLLEINFYGEVAEDAYKIADAMLKGR